MEKYITLIFGFMLLVLIVMYTLYKIDKHFLGSKNNKELLENIEKFKDS